MRLSSAKRPWRMNCNTVHYSLSLQLVIGKSRNNWRKLKTKCEAKRVVRRDSSNVFSAKQLWKDAVKDAKRKRPQKRPPN